MIDAVVHLGEIGRLAENVRCSAREVQQGMRLTPGGDAYEYVGSTSAVDSLLEALCALENFQASWR